MKRSGFAAAVTLAAMLSFGVSGALAASLPGSPLTKVAAHDGLRRDGVANRRRPHASSRRALQDGWRRIRFVEQGGKWALEQELRSPAGSATDT